MTSLEDKKEIILNHERRLANVVSMDVLDKPKLSVWMILIPIIFVFFFYRFKRYKEGREAFTDQFLITRRRALDVAADAVSSGHKPDIESIIEKTSSPKETLGKYRDWVATLMDHYQDLLREEGKDYGELVRKAYGKRANYLLFLNQVAVLEKKFDASLKPHLTESTEGVNDIVSLMEQSTEAHRRQFAEEIFS